MIAARPIAAAAISAGYGCIELPAGLLEFEFYDETVLATSYLSCSGEITIEYEDLTATCIIGVAGSTTVDDLAYDGESIIAETGLNGSGYLWLEFDDEPVLATDPVSGSLELTFDGFTGVAQVGTSGTGSALLEILEATITSILGIGTTGEIIFEFESPNIVHSYSVIEIDSPNPADIDTLAMPLVGYSMNTKTKAISAYTDNKSNTVPAVIATPVVIPRKAHKNYCRVLYATVRTQGDIRISLVAGEVKARREVQTIRYNENDGIQQRRAVLPHGLRSLHWQFFLENTDGASLQLTALSVSATISPRKS